MTMQKRRPLRRVYMGGTRPQNDIRIPIPGWFGNIRTKVVDLFHSAEGAWKGIAIVIAILLGIVWLWFYVVVVRSLPDFDKIKEGFSQTTVITDRNGKNLYKIFAQDREYVPYSGLSEPLIHAIISAEDKDFWTNQGVDYRGIVRAGLSALTKGSLQGPGGSTITQQLIKNMLLTSDKSIIRKAKEIVLATRIDDYLKKEVEKETPGISGKEEQRATKQKILEMYLNYIFLGNNAYGVEAASKTYFGKSAKDLDVMESAVLASMPQSPSTLNPYRNVDRLMGVLTIKDANTDKDASTETGVVQQAQKQFITAINTSSRSISKSSDGVGSWLEGRGDFTIEVNNKKYDVTYVPGRKDYVLGRMFEDGYIKEADIKQAAQEGVAYVFKNLHMDIQAPHFVFWIQDLLKGAGCEKNVVGRCFTDEELAKGGFTIKTTLDLDEQIMAEKSITDNMATIRGYGANNSSLVYLDSRDGDVLAYVGSADFNGTGLDGKVDMVQQQRQPGSSIKPLVYAYGFMNLPLTMDTPIYDTKTTLGKDTPNDNDGLFMGPMPLKRALGYSRNIPAIKMYFAVGEQYKLVPYLNSIGIDSYNAKTDYGYPMAIGSAELKMLELANAYAHLSAMGRPAKINPILEIRGPDGQIIYQKQPEQQTQVIPQGVAYLMRKILSDGANLPSAWVNNFLVRGLVYANKSGTTDMVDTKTGKKYPRDGWLVGYTPSKVAIFRAGNTQGNAMNLNAYGGWVNGKTFRQFFTQLVAAKKIQTEDVSPVEVKNVTISKISGKLASDSTPEAYKVNTMGYINTLPSMMDDSLTPIQIDKACMGKVTDATPRSDVISTYIVKPESFMPNGMDVADITTWFTSLLSTGTAASQVTGAAEYSFNSLVLKAPENVCSDRPLLTQDPSIAINIRKPGDGAGVSSVFNVWYDVTSLKPIVSVRVLVDDMNVGEFTYPGGKTTLSDIKRANLPTSGANHTLTVIALNQDGGYNKKTINIYAAAQDNTAPLLLDDKVSVIKRGENSYDVTLLFVDESSAVKGGSLSMKNGVLLKKFDGSVVTLNIQVPQELVYQVTDTSGNTKNGSVDVAKYVK